MTDDLAQLRHVWWELFPGFAARAYDLGNRRFLGLFSQILAVEPNGQLRPYWVHTSSLIDRT